jgi:nucleotide-binding universal stress UspA family protein
MAAPAVVVTDESGETVARAARLARLLGSRLHLVGARQPRRPDGIAEGEWRDRLSRQRREIAECLADEARPYEQSGIDVTTHSGLGDAREVAEDVARAVGPAIIVSL